jgi:hypothetical protein
MTGGELFVAAWCVGVLIIICGCAVSARLRR